MIRQLEDLYRFCAFERFLRTKFLEQNQGGKIMTKNCSRVTAVFVAMFLVVFMASSAMAINLNSRSEEMTANSDCDLAGTITLTFTQTDYNNIMAYLSGVNNVNGTGPLGTGTENAVIIRVSLSGTDIPPTADVPQLCEPIVGSAAPIGAAGVAMATNLVALQSMTVEVSDIADDVGGGADGIPDVSAYVVGVDGSQYFTIYITDIQAASNWSDENTFPWIKVGLYQDLLDVLDNETTAICADVHDFGGLSKLTVSLDLTPSSLTYTTADNQIGHFLVAEVDLRDCDKTETCANPTTETIELCPREAAGQAVACEDNYACFVIEGDLPPSDIATLEIRSNGATNGADTQSGVYITDVRLMDENDLPIVAPFTYYMADGTTIATVLPCDDESENAVADVDMALVAAGGDELRICITYQINPDEATVDTDVNFWVSLYMPPCGTIINGTISAATLVECGGIPSCMYFPYVITQFSPWQSGICVTNLSSDVDAAAMEVTFTLTDSTGTSYTYTKTDFTGTVWAAFIDSILSEFSGTPAAGPAWLYVEANCTIDGYEFLTDGVFGAGTLPRILTSCGTMIGADATR